MIKMEEMSENDFRLCSENENDTSDSDTTESLISDISIDERYDTFLRSTIFLENIKYLQVEDIYCFTKGEISDELILEGMVTVVLNCAMECNVKRQFQILFHLEKILFRNDDIWNSCLIRVIAQATTLLHQNLLSFLIKRSADIYSQIKTICQMKTDNWKQILKLYSRHKKQLAIKQILHLTDFSMLTNRTDKIIASIFRYKLHIYHQEYDQPSLVRLFNRILSTPLLRALDIILRYTDTMDLISGLCRFGIFQDVIERNLCNVVSRMLREKAIVQFYRDIIKNLLERKSPIIHTATMYSILRQSIMQ